MVKIGSHGIRFSRFVPKNKARKIKYTAGKNTYGERIKAIDKKSKKVDCQTRNAEESWEHVALCDKHKQIRDEWIKSLRIIFNEIAKKMNATDCKKQIIDEM